MLEAVKVEGRTPDRPLTDFGPLWTDRRRLCVVVLALWRVMAGLPGWWRAAPAIPRPESLEGTRPALDGNRRWPVAPFAGSPAGPGLGQCVMGWRGQSRQMPKPEFWTGSGRISASTSRWNAVGAVNFLMRGRLATIDRRLLVQNGQGRRNS